MTETSYKFNQMLTFSSQNIFCTHCQVTQSGLPFKRAFRFSIFFEILHGVAMTCAEACFAKRCGYKEDPDQAVIYAAAGDVESESGSEDEDSDN